MSADRQGFLKLARDIFAICPKRADETMHITFFHTSCDLPDANSRIDKCFLCLCSNLDRDQWKTLAASSCGKWHEVTGFLGKCSQDGIFSNSGRARPSFTRWAAILTLYVYVSGEDPQGWSEAERTKPTLNSFYFNSKSMCPSHSNCVLPTTLSPDSVIALHTTQAQWAYVSMTMLSETARGHANSNKTQKVLC